MKTLTHSLILLFVISACETPTPEAKPESTPSKESASTEDTKDIDLYQVKPIKLIPEALGKFERKITTNSEDAQNFFNQGIQLKYAFAVNEGVSSFREAQKIDSTCAMCFYGEAWALGSYLNGRMSEEKAPVALAALNKAKELAENYANDTEKALINAMTVRYVEDYVMDTRRVQDSLYALSMEKVYAEYPDDLDVATIYAEAMFLLEPRRGTREMDDPGLMKIHDVLENVLAANIEHPGACHLYIHSTESSPEPQLGEACADFLGDAIPGASHINHMPSHTWNEVGQWGKSVRANLQAWHTDQKAEQGKAFAIYPSHNLHMLLYSAAYDGQGAIAIQAGKDYAKTMNNNMFQALTLIRFGRFDEVLALGNRPDGIVAGSFWDFCQGYAELKTGNPDFAKVYMERVLNTADTTSAGFRFYKGPPLLKVLGTILKGEIARESGDLNGSITIFKAAVKTEDGLAYSEPEPLPFAARHWLGDALLEAEKYAEAEKVYRAEIADHPHNGWSLYGLVESLKAQSKSYAEEQADLDQSWGRADVWLNSSRY